MCVCVCTVELGLHGLVVQSQSRGDDDHPIGGDGASGRGSAGADVTYTSLPSCKQTSHNVHVVPYVGTVCMHVCMYACRSEMQ